MPLLVHFYIAQLEAGGCIARNPIVFGEVEQAPELFHLDNLPSFWEYFLHLPSKTFVSTVFWTGHRIVYIYSVQIVFNPIRGSPFGAVDIFAP